MHAERYRVPAGTMEACERTGRRRQGRRRRHHRGAGPGVRCRPRRARGPHRPVHPPGYEFRVVDRLLTNFHLPRSSLLVLIDSFAGPRCRGSTPTALAGDYRFLSFGDCHVAVEGPVGPRAGRYSRLFGGRAAALHLRSGLRLRRSWSIILAAVHDGGEGGPDWPVRRCLEERQVAPDGVDEGGHGHAAGEGERPQTLVPLAAQLQGELPSVRWFAHGERLIPGECAHRRTVACS